MTRINKAAKRLQKAIEAVEKSGLGVYRSRRKDREFMKIYKDALDELLPKISPSAFKVFAALANEVGYENTIVEIKKLQLMAKTNLSEKTVRNALNELEILGVMKRLGAPNERKYVLNEMYIRRGKPQ